MAESRAGGGVQSCSLFCGEPKTEPGTGPRPGRLREATAHTRMCVCSNACAWPCVSEPQDARPPISRNRAEHEMLGERSDPAAAVAGLLRRGREALKDDVLLRTAKWSLG